MEIIPGILARTEKELKKQLRKVSFAKKIHIDIMDGIFVPNKTFPFTSLKKFPSKQKIQIHLMTKNPEKYVQKLIELEADEIILHAESTKRAQEILRFIKTQKTKAGIALSPKTKPEQHKKAIQSSDTCLIMTVTPGFSGQKFKKEILKKIKTVKKIKQNITIGVDGGVNSTTCTHAKQKGASFAIATSACTLAKNPKKSYEELKKCK